MIKTVKELKSQIWSEEYWSNPATDKLLPLQLNKFAQLIILECANFVADQDENNFPSPVTISRRIKNHFGVE